MLARFRRILLLDVPVVLALVFPGASTYLRWPLFGLYAVITWRLLRSMSESRWVLRVVHDPRTRIAHGLEHATLAVLVEDGLPARRGFTHGRDRFVVVLEAGNEHQLATVREAAARSIRRIRDGEASLAYQPGCGTSELVSALTLWLVFVSSLVFSLVIGGSVPIFFAVSVIVFRFWLACHTALGLLAQRLFTVSTAFTSASVVDVRQPQIRWPVRSEHETWFEILVDFQVDPSEGGLVAPGSLV